MDPDIFTLASDCRQSFVTLGKELLARPTVLMPRESVENEGGRFRVWCGNLGALQQSFASLDYRLRESPVILSTVCGLLQQLRSNLDESISVVSGSRLAFEDQTQPGDSSDESADDSEDDDGNPIRQRHELSMRLLSIVDLVKKLYELGFRIRDPRLRPSSSKATRYREIDPDTGVDLFDAFPQFDRQHVDALLESLRRGREPPSASDEDPDYLMPRLAASITLRRKHFRYWEKHGKKLSLHTVPRIKPVEATEDPRPASQGQRNQVPQLIRPLGTDEPKTLMSMTEATNHQDNLDDMTERGTVVSYASTTLDADGHRLELPNPPTEALRGKDFVCPYCSVICPARYGQRKAWRSHVLHDLQPYICTYQDCPEPSRLYRSKRQWADHESSRHRRLYRCYEHPELLYKTPDRLKAHLQREHSSRLTDEQIDSLVELSGVNISDERSNCPICFEPAPFAKGLENHLAHHLERLAMFALPRPVEDGASTTDKLDSEGMGKRSSDSGRSLGPPVFSDHGAPNSAASDQNSTPREPESLIPRRLEWEVSADPEFRLDALRVIHDLFCRLNGELSESAKDDEKMLVRSPQELVCLALDEEQRVATESPSTYRDAMMQRILIYQEMTPGQWRDKLVEHDLGRQIHSIPPAGEGEVPQEEGQVEETPEQRLQKLDRRTFDRWRKVLLGSRRFDVWSNVVDAAEVLRRKDRLKRATLLLIFATKGQSAHSGAAEFSKVYAFAELAHTYGERGLWDESGNLLVKLVEMRKASFGDEDEPTLLAMERLAAIYFTLKQWKESESLWKDIIKIRERKGGIKENAKMLVNLAFLATVYQKQDRLDEAETINAEIEELSSWALKSGGLLGLHSVKVLATFYGGRGKLDEAVGLLERLLKAERVHLGETHHSTIETMGQLAVLLHDQGYLERALGLMRKSVQLQRKHSGRINARPRANISLLAEWEREWETRED
ncbi:uncharacterized protein B0H64DRAFT_379530 [Chaetomium fimeti]|uniref:Oxidoreductase acuF-like C2H2 type zinc-finger domain-containing protein n=1 Tax=Chaetomium fimeti TaxID=1854472 RepID=A0AAE0HPE4_9PEZI|nr:hypothetical protein B0H64DRAFT_379530 [Chaetomium fimeti]